MSGVAAKASCSRFLIIVLACVVAFRIGAALYTAGDTELTVWGDRDLWRALTFGSSWPLSGPEINGGLRPPGGAFYLLLGSILAIHPSVLAANIGLLFLFAASLLTLGLITARDLTPRVGMLAAVALAGTPMLATVLKVWNPGYLLFFATLATVFGYRYLKTGQALALGIAGAAIAIGLQIHLQTFQLAVALAVAGLIVRPGWSWRHLLVLVLGLGLPYLPTLLGGGDHLFAAAATVPAGAVENYLLWEFHPLEKVQLIYGLLGGTVASPGVTFRGLTIPARLGDLLAALLVLGFLGWTSKSLRHPRERAGEKIRKSSGAGVSPIGARIRKISPRPLWERGERSEGVRGLTRGERGKNVQKQTCLYVARTRAPLTRSWTLAALSHKGRGLMGVSPAFWRSRKRAEGRQNARPLGVFALITVVYLVVGLVSTVNGRHMVAVWPAVAVITGVAADAVLRRLAASRRHPRLAKAGCVLLVCALAVRPIAIGAASLGDDEVSLGSVAAQAEIAATVKSAFYADHEDFDAHAALFWRPGGRAWQLVQEGVSGQMTFIYRTTPASPVKSDRGECLAILPKKDMTGAVRAELARSRAFSDLAPVFAPIAAESAHFAYFPYTTADGNCLKSFPNAYIPTRFEAAFLQPGPTPRVSQSADAAQFVAALPDQTFPIGLELRRAAEGNYLAVLHGRLLRGYTGLHFATIVNPTLCLAGDGGVRVVPVGRLTVGSPLHGSLTPWQSPHFALADGTYRLWLVGRDGKTPQAVQIPLGLVVLPDMRAEAPAAGEATPPTGCPVPITTPPGGAG